MIKSEGTGSELKPSGLTHMHCDGVLDHGEHREKCQITQNKDEYHKDDVLGFLEVGFKLKGYLHISSL